MHATYYLTATNINQAVDRLNLKHTNAFVTVQIRGSKPDQIRGVHPAVVSSEIYIYRYIYVRNCRYH